MKGKIKYIYCVVGGRGLLLSFNTASLIDSIGILRSASNLRRSRNSKSFVRLPSGTLASVDSNLRLLSLGKASWLEAVTDAKVTPERAVDEPRADGKERFPIKTGLKGKGGKLDELGEDEETCEELLPAPLSEGEPPVMSLLATLKSMFCRTIVSVILFLRITSGHSFARKWCLPPQFMQLNTFEQGLSSSCLSRPHMRHFELFVQYLVRWLS